MTTGRINQVVTTIESRTVQDGQRASKGNPGGPVRDRTRETHSKLEAVST